MAQNPSNLPSRINRIYAFKDHDLVLKLNFTAGYDITGLSTKLFYKDKFHTGLAEISISSQLATITLSKNDFLSIGLPVFELFVYNNQNIAILGSTVEISSKPGNPVLETFNISLIEGEVINVEVVDAQASIDASQLAIQAAIEATQANEEAQAIVPTLQTDINARIPLSQKGVANGVGTLGSDLLQPLSQVKPNLIPSVNTSNLIASFLKTGNTYYGLKSFYTGLDIIINQTTTKSVGGTITDSDVDNVIYFKFSDGSYGERKFINDIADVREFGAVGDYNVTTKTGTDNVAAIQKAVNSAYNVIIPKGIYWLNLTDASKTIRVPSGRKITFEEGATIAFGMQDIYYAAFLCIKSNVFFDNPSFLWTGKLTFGVGLDNIDGGDTSLSSKRYETANSYINRHYCSAIFCAETSNIKIRNIKAESITKDGNSVMYNWIHAVSVDYLYVEGAVLDDMLLGVMSQGGYGGRISDITTRRMSQDVGIPGHVVYSFRTNCIIENIEDRGEETGLNPLKRISHTVSQKNKSTIKNITSRRAAGVLNISSDLGADFSGIVWEENSVIDSVDATPKLYLVTTSDNIDIIGSNVTMKAKRTTCPELFGGGSINGQFSNIILSRTDTDTPVNGFLSLKGTGNIVKAKLIQNGTFDAKVFYNFDGIARRNRFEIELINFIGSPIINVQGGANYNDFIIQNNWRDSTSSGRNIPLGSPATIFNGSFNNNWIGYSDGVASFVDTFSASVESPLSTVSASWPLIYGSYLVTIEIATNNNQWLNSYTYLVKNIKRNTNAILTALMLDFNNSLIGAASITSPEVVVTQTSISFTANIGNTTARNADHKVFCSIQRIAV